MNASDDIFSIIDKHDLGYITVKELQDFLYGEEVDVVLIDEIIEEVDKDLDMRISKEELSDIWRDILASIPVSEKLITNDDSEPTEAFQQVPFTYDVSFSNLNLCLHNGTTILKNISGNLGSHQVTALMGPSGSNSSSLHIL